MKFYSLEEIVDALLPEVQKKVIIGFDGPMGSGKTTLISAILSKFQYHLVNSPTFALINRYTLSSNEKKSFSAPSLIYHIDLYRLKNQEEIENTGFWDLFHDEESCIFVEWSQYIPIEFYPMDWKFCQVMISKNNDDENRIYKVDWRS